MLNAKSVLLLNQQCDCSLKTVKSAKEAGYSGRQEKSQAAGKGEEDRCGVDVQAQAGILHRVVSWNHVGQDTHKA